MKLRLSWIPYSDSKALRQFTLFAVGLFLYTGAQAQTDFAEHFIASADKNKVYLRWTILAGNTCNGMVISRSTDKVNFQQIEEIFGVCGSGDSAQTFQYIDEQPELNKTNVYKIQFGYTGNTISQSVFVYTEGAVALIPNPGNTSTRLYFTNSQGQTAVFVLYDMGGRALQTLETKNSQVVIDLQRVPAGVYGFLLTLPTNTYKGTLSVVH